MLEREIPTQQELVAAIVAAWKHHEGNEGSPHAAWAIYAAHAVEALMRGKLEQGR